MANFYFKKVIKNFSFFRVSKWSILLRIGLHLYFMYFFIIAFHLTSPSLSAQYTAGPKKQLNSVELQEKIQELKWTRMNFNTFYPGMDRSRALFCRWEYAIEQNSRIPFRFRLGTLDYVDQLENKRTPIR